MNSEQTASNQREILVVDDAAAGRRLLEHMMMLQGYSVRSASNGRSALAAATESPPDLILMDVMMPDMDGFEVADQLQGNPQTQAVPIIFISALDSESDKVRAFSSGGVDYVTKPLHMNEVVARVRTHLRLRDAQDDLQHQLEEREALIDELDTVNAQLKQEVAERQAAQEAREASLELLRQALMKTEALYRITRSLITSEDIPDMLQIAVDSVAQALPADRVVVSVLDLDEARIRSFVAGGSGADAVTRLSYGELMEGLSGWVVERIQPVISPKDYADPRESAAARQRRSVANAGSILVVPLYYQDTMMGTMTAINRPDQRDFTEQDLAQLSAVAGQVAIALANAQLSVETAYLKEFNEGIVQGVAEAILMLDSGGTITFANPAAEAMLGYDPDELVGIAAEQLFPEYDLPLGEGDGGKPDLSLERTETILQTHDGRAVPVLANIRSLYKKGVLEGGLVALTDITELKEAEQQLRQYAADLEAQNAELDAFAHTVAHDLRSPLTGLIGFIDLLRQQTAVKHSSQAQTFVQYVHRNAAKMNNIIDELLLLASVREVDAVDLRPIDMQRTVHEIWSRLDYLIDEYQAEVIVPDTWPEAIGYPSWVEEVWVNYFSNALKYGGRPKLGIRPVVELGYDMTNGGGDAASESEMIRFWVRDNGLGLTDKERAQLFTPFERLHNVRVEGHGLGLSIVRRIVEKLGGEVGVESTLGEGSLFYFTLPRASES
jgi:PAS domain S-box-containing protein